MNYNAHGVLVNVCMCLFKFECLVKNVLGYWWVKFFNIKLNKTAVTFVCDVIELF